LYYAGFESNKRGKVLYIIWVELGWNER